MLPHPSQGPTSQCPAFDFVALWHSVFNVYVARNISPGRFLVCWINGYETDMVMEINASGQAEFLGGVLRPSVAQLRRLQLHLGRNHLELKLRASPDAEDLCSVYSDLWLWDCEDRVAVVDIDGTVTRSDVRGFVASGIHGAVKGTAEFLCNALSLSSTADDAETTRTSIVHTSIMNTAVTAEYIHDGVAEALQHLSSAGLRIFYLTARPITWIDTTRAFLLSVGQVVGMLCVRVCVRACVRACDAVLGYSLRSRCIDHVWDFESHLSIYLFLCLFIRA